MKISNVEELRDLLLDSIDKVVSKKMPYEELSILAKTSEAICSSIKMEMIYAGMRKEEPNIKFLNVSKNNKLIDVNNGNVKKLIK